jgi:tetratricopeptide (TPR) repeat protein
MNENQSINIGNGEYMDNRKCFIRAIDIDPRCARAYNGLGNAMHGQNDAVKLDDGRLVAQPECYVAAIDARPSFDDAYYNLGRILDDSDTVTLLSGETISRIQCFVRAIDFSTPGEVSSRAYCALAMHMPPAKWPVFWPWEETVTVNTVDVLTRRECLVRAVRHDPRNAHAFYALGLLMSKSEKVYLDTGALDKRQCLVRAMDLDPSLVECCAAALNGMATCTLL